MNSYNDINQELEEINEKLSVEEDEIKIKELKKQIRQLNTEKKFLENEYGDLSNFDINILKTRKQNRDYNHKRISNSIADIQSDINKLTRMFEKNGYSVDVDNRNLILLRGNYGVQILITPVDKQKITDAFHQGAIGYLLGMGAKPYNR
jgi:predicted  nucleic acid-binding Zn-ribbon protein